MGRCVAAQHLLAAYVICVIGAAADVICWDQDLVKVCFACDDWEHVVKVLVESWLGLVKVVIDGLWGGGGEQDMYVSGGWVGGGSGQSSHKRPVGVWLWGGGAGETGRSSSSREAGRDANKRERRSSNWSQKTGVVFPLGSMLGRECKC